MKRIANDVAVRTVCYCISGLRKVRIVDYDDPLWRVDGTTVCDGLLKDVAYECHMDKYFDSKVHAIDTDGDTIVFSVCTKRDKYK